MNYLFRYLCTLLPHELGAIDRVRTTPRERQVIDLLVEMRARPDSTRAEALDRLAMSASMFDKTCSVLLRRVLEEMAPQGDLELLEHLVLRNVNDLFLHELRRLEKKTLATGSREEALRFYREAFRVLHLRFTSQYSEATARRIAGRYRRLDPSSDVMIYTEAYLITMSIWSEASQRKGDRQVQEKRLRRNDARIVESTGAEARHRQLKAWITYYGQLKRDPDQRLACLRAAVDLCERHPDILPVREKIELLCQIAEDHYFYRTDLTVPLEMYRKLYEEYPGSLEQEVYHLSKFIQLCIINGDYARAEELLIRHFGADAGGNVHDGGKAKGAALLWTKLLLMEDRLGEAQVYLERAVLLNQKGFFLQFEVECRMLHTVLCFLREDFDTIERRLQAHLKFLRSKGITFKTSRYYPWFFKIVSALVDERTTGRRMPTKLVVKWEEFMEGAAAQYGVLLRKMRSARS